MSLITELRQRAEQIRRQRAAELESFRMSRKGESTFLDDLRFIQALTQGRRVRP